VPNTKLYSLLDPAGRTTAIVFADHIDPHLDSKQTDFYFRGEPIAVAFNGFKESSPGETPLRNLAGV
jgi:hypothetical protein